MDSVSQSRTTVQVGIAVTLPFAWGLRDGANGRSLYDGYDYFCGRKFLEYERGWNAGRQLAILRALQAAKVQTGDPMVAIWQAEGAPKAGCSWDGDYSDCTGSEGEEFWTEA